MTRSAMILAALSLFGCSSRPEPDTVTRNVTVGALSAPTCQGTMTLPAKIEGLTAGTWQCGSFQGNAFAQRQAGMIFLDLETTPGFLNRVRATESGWDIAGDMTIDDHTTPFTANAE